MYAGNRNLTMATLVHPMRVKLEFNQPLTLPSERKLNRDPDLAISTLDTGVKPEKDTCMVDSSKRNRIDVLQLECERSIGMQGDKKGELRDITGIAADEEHVYVADAGKDCIQVFDRRNGKHVYLWGGTGKSRQKLDGPQGLAVHGEYLYCADFHNARVQVYTTSGVFVQSIGGSGNGVLEGPYGVAVDDENVVVTSYLGNFLSLFDKDKGNFVRRIGSAENRPGQFNHPCGVALDSGYVYVADTDNHRVQVLTKEGVFLRMIGGGVGTVGPGQLFYPHGVAVDTNHVYICDVLRTQVFEKLSGRYVGLLEKKKLGEADEEAAVPHHLVIYGDRVYLTDVVHDVIDVYLDKSAYSDLLADDVISRPISG